MQISTRDTVDMDMGDVYYCNECGEVIDLSKEYMFYGKYNDDMLCDKCIVKVGGIIDNRG